MVLMSAVRFGVIVLTLCTPLLLAAPVGGKPSEAATRVTLEKRTGDGSYDRAAYSFRHASQDLDVHGNRVDLLFDACGLLHIDADAGLQARVVRASATKLQELTAVPDGTWFTKSFTPEKGAVYVQQIEDAWSRLMVKFRILGVAENEIVLEWAPFPHPVGGVAGSKGHCGGPHDPE